VHLALPRPSASALRFTPSHVDFGTAAACGKNGNVSGEKNGQDRKDRRPQEGNGHHQEHGLPQVWQATRVVKRLKDRERDIPGGMYISCSACEFYEKL